MENFQPLLLLLGMQVNLSIVFDPSGFQGTWKGDPSYIFIRLLFILMVHQVTARVNSQTVTWMKNSFLESQVETWVRGRNLHPSPLRILAVSEQSGLVLRVTVFLVSFFFLIRKSLESPGVTFWRGAFEGWDVSNRCFLNVFHLWVLPCCSQPHSEALGGD